MDLQSGNKGTPRRYDGKVYYNDLSKWNFAGTDNKPEGGI